MESLDSSAALIENLSDPHISPPITTQPETSVQGNFTLRSQIFRKKVTTFLPFKQRKTPPRAEEWIGNLANILIPPPGDIERLGALQEDWAIKTNSRGSCPLLHTLYYEGRAQSAWDPMPEEMLAGYLEMIAGLPYSFADIVEEYLPGVFNPIRKASLSATEPLAFPPWYPKPILIAACVFAERRILNDPRVTEEDSEDEDSDDENTYPNNLWAAPASAGAALYNQYADLGSDTESEISFTSPDSPCTIPDSFSDSDGASICSDNSESASSISDDSDVASMWDTDFDSASTCTDFSDNCQEIVNAAAEASEGDSDDSDDADNSEGDSMNSRTWEVGVIIQRFQEMQEELERHGLELHSYI